MRNLFIIMLLFFTGSIYSQMGVQIEVPRQILHVDGQKNTPKQGTPTLAQTLDDFTVTNQGRVGIRNISPEKPLDVEANNDAIRLRNLSVLPQFSTTSGSELITRNPNNGDLTGVKLLFSLSQSITSNSSYNFVVDEVHNITQGIATVYAANACGRTMLSQFVFNKGTMFFIGGMGRDVIGIGSIIGMGNASNANESVVWRVVFPSVVGCEDGGDSNQFNFDIQKIGPTTFRVTSRSNIAKTFSLSIERF